MENIIIEAKKYIDMGWPIFPCCPASAYEHEKTSNMHKKFCQCRGKVPLIKNWAHKKPTTMEELDSWLEEFENFNIALPMGSSSGYVSIDIDGAEGEEILQNISLRDVPDSWEFKTGQGRRIIYTIPIGLETKKNINMGEKKHQECSILCQGQMTIIPPSVHYTGKIYSWKDGHSPYDMDCCPAPNWLIQLISVEKSKRLETVSTFELAPEFESAPFSSELPEEFINMKEREIKPQKIKEESIDATSFLYKKVNEGGRDNAITKIIGYFLSQDTFRKMPEATFKEFILNYNTTYMNPPLDIEAVNLKIAYFRELEEQKEASSPEMVGEKEWKISSITRMLKNNFDNMHIRVAYDKAIDKFYYCYTDKGPWILDDNDMVESKIWQWLKDDTFGDESWGSMYKLREAEAAFELDLRAIGNSKKQIFDMNAHAHELSDKIVVNGQLLDWASGTITSWDPNYKSTLNFEIPYDKGATCPNWLKYMAEWLPNEETRNLLQEFMGSALLPEPAPEEKFIILTGSGSNGKSMFLKGMQMIFQEYSISLTPQKLSERFGPASLYGKLINICSEIEGDSGYLKNTAQIKQIVSGEPLTAEFKGKDAFQFQPIANLIFSCNDVPKVKDKSDAWIRRQIIIPFKQKFKPDSRKSAEMLKTMRAELPGIFNWLIQGLVRIKKRGYFIISTELVKTQIEFHESNDPIVSFLSSNIKMGTPKEFYELTGKQRKDIGVSTKVILTLYTLWCSFTLGGHQEFKKSPKTFSDDMAKKGFEKCRGYCCAMQKQTAIFNKVKIELRNYEFCQYILDACVGQGISEPGYYLYETAKEAMKIFNKTEY